MFNLFRKKKPTLSLKTMSAEVLPWSVELRRSPEAVDAMARWLKHPQTRLVLDMLKNESPEKRGRGVPGLDTARHLGKIEGWYEAVDFITNLSHRIDENVEPPMTFQEEQE